MSSQDRIAGALEATWRPAAEGSDSDLWLACDTSALPEGRFFSLEFAADTVDGAAVSGACEIVVTPRQGDAASEGEALWQPLAGVDYDAEGLGLGAESGGELRVTIADAAVPPDGAAGPVYRIGPETVFETPQRVWLPVPDGLEGEELALMYHVHGEGQGWRPAQSVANWLVPGSELYLELEDAAYYGFTVRHGGLAVLSAEKVVGPAEAPISGTAGGRSGRQGPAGPRLLLTLMLLLAAAALGVAQHEPAFKRVALLLQTDAGPMLGMVCWSGYYKDKNGVWRIDRRQVPDRRMRRAATPEQLEQRKTVRREVDRQVIAWSN